MLTLQRIPALIASGATLLFLIALLHQHRNTIPSPHSIFAPKPPLPSFLETASKHRSNKVAYHDMYSKYLPALRSQPLKMLEIGLGCDGPAPSSYYTWLEYFPHVELYYIEADGACAVQWANRTTGATVFAGDRAIDRFTGEGFDIVVDDGKYQTTGLQHLFKSVKPGGLYFCEGLAGKGKGNGNGEELAMMQFVMRVIEDLAAGERRQEFEHADQVVHVDCSREICVLEKRKAEVGVGGGA